MDNPELPSNTVMDTTALTAVGVKAETTAPLDYAKPIQTRDGRPVRILCVDAKRRAEPVVGLIQFSDGEEMVGTWTISGLYNSRRGEQSGNDLVNAPPEKKKVKVFVELRMHAESKEMYCVSFPNRRPWPSDNITLGSTEIEMEYEERS